MPHSTHSMRMTWFRRDLETFPYAMAMRTASPRKATSQGAICRQHRFTNVANTC